MTALQAAALGFVQGLTEFLPVSSSGHLVLLQEWWSLTEPTLVFDVLLHLATLLAVVIFFFQEIKALRARDWLVVAVGSVPAALFGLLFDGWLEIGFTTVWLVGLALLVTAAFNWRSDRCLQVARAAESDRVSKHKSGVSPRQGLVIGLFQALALIPGISRSGATVFAGLHQGLERIPAFRFSFILSMPAILGATLLQLRQLSPTAMTQIWSGPYLLGATVAFLTGLAGLYLFKLVMKKANLRYFAYYCLVLGCLVLITSF